jgi:predicted phosphodiesterase
LKNLPSGSIWIISGLTPATKYYYSIDTFSGSDEQYFITSPPSGNTGKTRIWVISDFGQTDVGDNVERMKTVNRWKIFNDGSYHADFILSLGDQTENDIQEELQETYFDLLNQVLPNSPLFTLEGNHDNYDSLVNYKATFSVPESGEAGGYPSNNQDYYSSDYANIHIVMLSTEIDDIDGPQLSWLRNDLKNIDEDKTDWLIACLHRPFHSGGYHPTNISSTAQEQRDYWLKELEDCGVDIILQGHNAIYERSFLLDNLIGKTTDLTDENIIDSGNGREDVDGAYYKGSGINPHQGTIFIEVAPGGYAVNNNANYPIFSYAFSGGAIEGSVVLDIDSANRLDGYFLCNRPDSDSSYLWDYFTIIKSDTVNTGSKTMDQATWDCKISNYPNPFQLSTNISYRLVKTGNVKIEIYDLLGRRLSILVDSIKEKGEYTIEWTAKDDKGNNLPDGLYIAQICTDKMAGITRLMLIR